MKQKKVITKKLLEHLYWGELKNMYEISRELKISEPTVSKLLDKFEIPKRTVADYAKLRKKRELGDIPDKALLKALYIDQDYTRWGIADTFNVSERLVAEWLKFHGIRKNKPYKIEVDEEKQKKMKAKKEEYMKKYAECQK